MPFGDRRLYGVCCAEKGTFRFRVRARGRAGHAVRAGAGRQRAAQARSPRWSASAPAAPPTTSSTSRARCCAPSARTRPTRSVRVASIRASEPALAALVRAHAGRHVRADDHRRRLEDQRDPRARRVRRRLPAPARPGRRRRARPRHGAARRRARRAGARLDRGHRGQPLAALVAADGRHRRLGGRGRSRRRGRPDHAARLHRLAAGSGPRSRTASPTASSRSATRPCTSRGR